MEEYLNEEEYINYKAETSEEYRKITELTKLYYRQMAELRSLNHRQKKINRNINRRKKQLIKENKKIAIAIIEGQEGGSIEVKKPGVIRQAIDGNYIVASIISLLVYVISSKIAYIERGYKAIGGEGFFLIFPIILLAFKAAKIMDENNSKEQKKKGA